LEKDLKEKAIQLMRNVPMIRGSNNNQLDMQKYSSVGKERANDMRQQLIPLVLYLFN
jgi:hypothetical protein